VQKTYCKPTVSIGRLILHPDDCNFRIVIAIFHQTRFSSKGKFEIGIFSG